MPGWNPYSGTPQVAGTAYLGGSQTNTGGAVQQQQQQNYNYGAGQQNLQGLVPNAYSNLLGGGFGSFVQPATNAYNQQFFTQPGNIASTLAAQYGAGSPQIGSQYQQGLTNLYSNMMPQYTNTIGQAGSYALTPTGQSQIGNETSQQSQNTAYGSTLLGMLMNAMTLSGLMTSDERVKEDIKEICKIGGLRLVRFRYKNLSWLPKGIQLGFIAQEVEKVFPEAVIKDKSGIRHIFMPKLFDCLSGAC